MKPKSRNRLFYPHFPRGPSYPELESGERQEVLGKGKFGRIVVLGKADDEGEVVVKIMQKRRIIEQKMIQQVLEEQSNHSRCSHHPNVLPLLSSHQDEHHLYMLFPRCATTLAKLLSARSSHSPSPPSQPQPPPLPPFALKAAIFQMSTALRFLHDLGVVHRDVKSENVLVSACGRRLQLGDFGLSKWLPRRKRTRTVCGTLQHMAPEILEERPYSHPVDWWSLGVLGHRLATGATPWPRGRDHREQLRLVDLRRVDLSGMKEAVVRDVVVACFDPDACAREKGVWEAVDAMGRTMTNTEARESKEVAFLDVADSDKAREDADKKGEQDGADNDKTRDVDKKEEQDGTDKENKSP